MIKITQLKLIIFLIEIFFIYLWPRFRYACHQHVVNIKNEMKNEIKIMINIWKKSKNINRIKCRMYVSNLYVTIWMNNFSYYN